MPVRAPSRSSRRAEYVNASPGEEAEQIGISQKLLFGRVDHYELAHRCDPAPELPVIGMLVRSRPQLEHLLKLPAERHEAIRRAACPSTVRAQAGAEPPPLSPPTQSCSAAPTMIRP